MTMAMSKAVEHGRQGRHLRVDRQHLGLRRGLRGPRRHHRCRAGSGGQDRDGQAQPGHRPQRAAAADPGQLRRLPRDRARTRRPLPGPPGQLGQPAPDRGPEDRGVRDRRGARRRPRLPHRAGRQRRQLHRVLPRLQRGARPDATDEAARGCSDSRPRSRRSCSTHREGPGDDRQRHPHRQPGIVGARRPRPGRRATATSAPSPTPQILAATASCRPRSASSSSPRRRSASPACSSGRQAGEIPKGATVVLTVTGHGLKDPQWAARNADGTDVKPRSFAMTSPRSPSLLGLSKVICMTAAPGLDGRRVAVKVPATTANLGAGFRHAGPRPVALRRADRHRRDRARARRSRCAGVGAGDVPTDESQPRRARDRPHFARVRQALPGLELRAHNAIPHGRDSGPPAPRSSPASWRRRACSRASSRCDADDAARPGHRAGGAPGQRRAGPLRRAHHRLDDAGRPALKKLIVHRGVVPLVCVPQSHDVHRARAQPAARLGAARGRDLQRVALRPAHRRADPVARSCCSRRPRTGCTRATVRAAMPETVALMEVLREDGWRRSSPARTVDPGARQRPRAAPARPRIGGRTRGHAVGVPDAGRRLQRCYSEYASGRNLGLIG